MAVKTRGMILAAGFGKRLRPLTYFRAKAAVPFLNRPFLSYSLELFRKCRIEEVMVNLHHLPHTVEAAVAGESAEVRFSFEDKILGTAGCLRKARDFLEGSTFVVSNGKTYFEQDLCAALDYHRDSGALVTMILVPYSPGEPYNPVLVAADGLIVDFARNRPEGFESHSDGERFCIYTGIQILEPKVLEWIPPGFSDSVNDVYPMLMSRGYPVRAFISSSYWCECSTPQRYLLKSLEVLNRKNRENLSLSPLPRGCRGAIVGAGVQVPEDTFIENSIVWGDTRLGARSSFRSVIIADGVGELPPDTHLKDLMVTPIREGSAATLTIRNQYALWPIS